MASLELIKPASPEVAVALVECAHKAMRTGKAEMKELVVDQVRVLVACKKTPESDPASSDKVHHLVLVRVDTQAAADLGLVTGKDLDRWLGTQEPALGALVIPWAGGKAPWPGERLVALPRNPGDPWAVHLTTKDRYRLSHWGVRPCL